MAQLSRPYQIALAALVFLVLVWFVALRGHGSSSSSTPVASTPAPTAAGEAKAAAAPTPVYHGAAPGVSGLTRAINKAHGAVATSQQDAHSFEHASAQAPSQSAEGAGASTTTAGSNQAAAPASTTKQAAAPASAAAKASKSAGIPARQAAVERELKQGKIVLVLFWNPKGADDVAVHEALQTLLAAHHEIRAFGHERQVHKLLKQVGLELDQKIAVHYASASQVASFGSFTRTVQVYGTPTTLIINKHGVVSTLNGLTDPFSIEQTIDEARKA